MFRYKVLTALVAAAFVVAFGVADSVSAKHKKVSYDQAWKICKDQMDKDKISVQPANQTSATHAAPVA